MSETTLNPELTLSKTFESLESLIEEAKTDLDKSVTKGNYAAGTRFRNSCMSAIKLLRELKKNSLDYDKSRKTTKTN